jgi:hypothetical protein
LITYQKEVSFVHRSYNNEFHGKRTLLGKVNFKFKPLLADVLYAVLYNYDQVSKAIFFFDSKPFTFTVTVPYLKTKTQRRLQTRHVSPSVDNGHHNYNAQTSQTQQEKATCEYSEGYSVTQNIKQAALTVILRVNKSIKRSTTV